MNAEEPVIRIRGLRNQFGEQVVHENLDLDVRRGEIIGVVGGSGSGKSVLLRSIVGFDVPQLPPIPDLASQASIKRLPNRSGSESARSPGNPWKLVSARSAN